MDRKESRRPALLLRAHPAQERKRATAPAGGRNHPQALGNQKKEGREQSAATKTLRARELGVSRSTLYYKPTKPDKDWAIKCAIEEVLREHPGYGSPHIALALRRNHKQVERVMRLFGIKAYRRRWMKYKKTKNIKVIYPNLLLTAYPPYAGHIWATDFTYIRFQCRFVYVGTVIDLYTRKIVGLAVYTTHAVPLVLSALMSALQHHARPA